MKNNEKNKIIAKNTLLLSVRMLLIMFITLYTSRVILNTLGVEDFGIYSVVGGIVMMFGFLNSSMATATQRFLSFELGKKDYSQLSKIFSISVNIHVIISLVILILAETIGLWVLNNKLTIPEDRIMAANWVYQFSILAFMVTIISVPYNAVIIAYERMNVFAVVSIIEVSLKLLIVFILQWLGFDKLKLYAVLVFAVALIIRMIYGIYTSRNFPECKYKFLWDKSLYKTIMNYASWSLAGNLSVVLSGQGVNILLNIFFGPAINAARAIAYQIETAVNGFIINFQTAMNPQIIKSYAVKDMQYMHQLIYQGAKFSFFIFFALSLPILMETKIILKVWLNIVPEYTIVFTQLIIINTLINSVSGPIRTAAQATGKIKLFQGVVGGLLLLNLPVSFVFLKLGFPPEITVYISIFLSVITLWARLKIVSSLVGISLNDFIMKVILKMFYIVFISVSFSLIVNELYPNYRYHSAFMIFISFIFGILSIIIFGLNNDERQYVFNKLKKLNK